MPLLTNQEFNKELKQLFLATKDKGSIFFTIKRVDHKQLKRKITPLDKQEVEDKFKCLIRVATDKKTISTYLNSTSVDKFLSNYNTLLRTEMSTLKKKVRAKKEKAQAKASN